jgi:hypothetical protein
VSSIPAIQPTLAYYLGLFTSQYQNPSAPNLRAFAALLLQPFMDTLACIETMNEAFSLNDAFGGPPVGDQLNVIGELVGVSRTLPFTPTGSITSVTYDVAGSGYVSGDVMNIVQGGASGGQVVFLIISGTHVYLVANPGTGYSTATGLTTTGGHGTGLTVNITAPAPSPVLDDADYLTLILATIINNQFNGQSLGANSTLWQAWQTLFPGGHLYITDNQNMTATVFVVGSFSQVMIQMIQNGLIVPQSEAVQYTYEFGTLPLFGFDGPNTFVAGFDTGNWG